MAKIVTTFIVTEMDEVKMVPSGAGTIGNFIDRRIQEAIRNNYRDEAYPAGVDPNVPLLTLIKVDITSEDWKEMCKFKK